MAQVNIRMDDDLKHRGDELFNELGISMAAAVNMFVAQSVREGGIPFPVTTKKDPFYSAENMKVLRSSIAAAEAGKLTAHELIEE